MCFTSTLRYCSSSSQARQSSSAQRGTVRPWKCSILHEITQSAGAQVPCLPVPSHLGSTPGFDLCFTPGLFLQKPRPGQAVGFMQSLLGKHWETWTTGRALPLWIEAGGFTFFCEQQWVLSQFSRMNAPERSGDILQQMSPVVRSLGKVCCLALPSYSELLLWARNNGRLFIMVFMFASLWPKYLGATA